MTSQTISEPRTHDDYTVGWVCALPKELTAAASMLDETHPDLPRQPNDHNVYTLGRVSGHNVVVACLPKGEIGNHNSATVATRMTSTFPSIRFGLMVGIGGGVPKSVRLGDVVVSTPMDGFGGVVYWDFGKTEQGYAFKRTGALNQPPTELLAALTKLETEHSMKGSKIPQYLEELKKTWPRLVPKYTRSESLKDVLFRADCKHLEKPPICDVGNVNNSFENVEEEEDDQTEDEKDGNHCINCDSSKIVRRKPRDMSVHYGLIASGNQVIKDATFRDEINKRFGGKILCFEMEAAGLMNNFPCIVIRGICDYADSHKNKDWQEHAAAVAAAFAKELLSVVPAQEVYQMPAIKVLLKIDSRLERVSNVVNELHSRQLDQDHQAVLDWLTPIDHDSQQSDYFRRRQTGTGQWLLESEEYQTWLKTSKQTLFCPGIPGAGKTILTSIIVDDLKKRFQNDTSVGITYLYCNFRRRGEQRLEDLLVSLLKQLSQERSDLPNDVKDLYVRHKDKRTRPSFEEILRTLQSVTAIYSTVFIIVDALDECLVSDSCRSKFLSEIFILQQKYGVNIFATSRPIPEVTEKFKGHTSLEIRANNQDVRKYLEGRILQSDRKFLKTFHEEIQTKITEAVDGMFLLAQLHFDTIETKTTFLKVQKALESLSTGPEAYDRVYQDAMERINGQVIDYKELARQVLSWIICAKRPLTTFELQHALAVEIGKTEINKYNLPEIEDMVSVCAGLVTIDEQSNIIRLVHYTTQEYFEHTQKHWFPNAVDEITIVCVTYLSFSVFESGFCQTDAEFEERLHLNKLYDYAAHNWGNHAREASTLSLQVIDFLESKLKTEAASQALQAIKMYSSHRHYSQQVPRQITGLHLAAYFGVHDAANVLASCPQSLNLKDTNGRTPLSWAVSNGHKAIVTLLLEKGVDLETIDEEGQTPLSQAVCHGHKAIVTLLLEKGADLETTVEEGQTPLSWAVSNGHEAMVTLLLEKGADLETIDEEGQTPLSLAVCHEHEAIVTLLLEKGADLETIDEEGHTPLAHAVGNEHEAIMTLLLEKGADLETRDEEGQTPLSRAISNGHEAMVTLLLEKGADLETVGQCGQTPLSWAVRDGHEAMATLLLEKGADLETIDQWAKTPLFWAIHNEHETIVALLLEKGANLEATDWKGHTPLLLAIENGHEAIVALLLEKGANLETTDWKGKTPLLLAIENGHNAMVALLLLEKGAKY